MSPADKKSSTSSFKASLFFQSLFLTIVPWVALTGQCGPSPWMQLPGGLDGVGKALTKQLLEQKFHDWACRV